MEPLQPQRLPAHRERLHRAAWALCGSRHDAEDLVQETFVRVLARPRRLHGADELGYLMRVLRNVYLTSLRTASRRPRTVALAAGADLVSSHGDPGRRLEHREVMGAIAALPDDFRRALVAVDIVGVSYREAAQLLGTSEATITTRLHRARRRVNADATGGIGPRHAT